MLRIGVIGCGYWGKNHVRVLIERGSLAGVCDADPAAVASVRRTHPGVAVYSLDEMLAHESVDAVVISTPEPSHYDLAEQALRAGKHVLVEKPMTQSYAQARRLVRLADACRLLITTGHQMQHHNAVRAMLRSISCGAIGDVTTVRTRRHRGRSYATCHVHWDLGPHDIAVILAVAGGRMPWRLRAIGQATKGLSQEVDIRMEFGDGTGLKTTSTMIWDYPVKEHKIVVNGTAGAFVFDDGQPWSKKLKFYPTDSDVGAARFSMTGTPDASDGGFFVPCCEEEPLKSEHSAFAKAIASYGDGSTESCAPDDLGADVVCLLELAHESLESDGSWRLVDEYLDFNQLDEGNDDGVNGIERRNNGRHRVRVPDLRIKSKYDYFVHDTSVLEPGCKIGSGTKIWLYSHVMPDAVIGPDCQLGLNVFVDAGVTIGRGCKLQNNVSVCRYVTLADGVFCGPSCTFTNDRRPRAEQKNWKPESTVVERGATIGANATVVCGVRIGRYAMIGAGAVVTKDVKAFALVYGNPAVQRGWVNDKRDKLSTDLVCPRTGKRFVVDDSGGPVPAGSVAGVEVTPGFPRARGDFDVDDGRRLLPETTDGETNRKSWLYLAASDGDQLDDSFQPSSAATDKENAINPDPNKTVSVIDICDGFRFSEDSSNKETNCESLLNQEDTNRISHNPRLETPTASADGDISPAPITFAGLDRQLKAIEKSLKSRVMSVIDNCQFIFGPDVALLEGELSRFCGCKHAVTCASGTDALRLALTAKGATRPHQAVFVPANTFCATVEAVVTTGATPVFVDVHRDTFNMDETSLLKAIELATRNGLRPTGVVAVDLYGQPADYDAIDAVARVNDLWVVADAAQSFGAERNGVKVGNLCEITTTSFYPAKALGCYGDGGAVFTNSDELAAAVRSLRAHGRSPRHKYHIERVGMNSRLDTVQAAVLLEKLKIFPDEIESRRRVAERYCGLLSPHGVATPTLPAGVSSSWTAYTVVLPADCDRGRVVDDLHRRHRIQTNVYYKPGPLHELPAFADYLRPELTVSDAIQPRILSLPVHGYLRRDEVKRVAGALVESLRK